MRAVASRQVLASRPVHDSKKAAGESGSYLAVHVPAFGAARGTLGAGPTRLQISCRYLYG
jgi:hypothetical protein